jgi:hypothetical protein
MISIQLQRLKNIAKQRGGYIVELVDANAWPNRRSDTGEWRKEGQILRQLVAQEWCGTLLLGVIVESPNRER